MQDLDRLLNPNNRFLEYQDYLIDLIASSYHKSFKDLIATRIKDAFYFFDSTPDVTYESLYNLDSSLDELKYYKSLMDDYMSKGEKLQDEIDDYTLRYLKELLNISDDVFNKNKEVILGLRFDAFDKKYKKYLDYDNEVRDLLLELQQDYIDTCKRIGIIPLLDEEKLDDCIDFLKRQEKVLERNVIKNSIFGKNILDRLGDIPFYKKILLARKIVYFEEDFDSDVTAITSLSKEYSKTFISFPLLKKYLDSIVDSILDNVESIRIRTRPSMPSFFDILTNRRIVYQSFQINNETVLKELEDSQSLLARKYKSLLTKINRFDMYVNQNVVDNLESFSFVIEEWIRKGHHLVLQKKPSFISIEPYLSLEEFNLSVHTHFTKKHHTIIRDFVDTMQSNLLALSIWVQATKKVLFECVISHLEKKFQHDKNLAKNCKAKEIKPLDRDFLINTILNILPEEIQRLFCELPSTKGTLDNIPALLHAETKENEKIIRYRIREIIDLRQNVKVATKILENAIAAYAKT